jgi:hypothetical protein
MDDAEREILQRAKSDHELRLISKAGVRSVAIGHKERGGRTTDELCIRVGVVRKRPIEELDERDVIDRELPIDGRSVPTDVVEIGEIEVLAPDTTRYRPVVGGALYNRGTVAGIVKDHTDDSVVALGCAHSMLVPSWSGSTFSADPSVLDTRWMFQPTVGATENLFARPKRSAGVTRQGNTLVLESDAAIASFFPGDRWTSRVVGSADVVDVGRGPFILEDPGLDQEVRVREAQSGRTLYGHVVEVDTTLTGAWTFDGVPVVIRNEFTIRSDADPFAIPGDSGSPVYAADSTDALGILSASAGSLGYASAIRAAFRALDLTVVCPPSLRTLIYVSVRRAQQHSSVKAAVDARAAQSLLLLQLLADGGGTLLRKILLSSEFAHAIEHEDLLDAAAGLIEPVITCDTVQQMLETRLDIGQIQAASTLASMLHEIGSPSAHDMKRLADWLSNHEGEQLIEAASELDHETSRGR